MSRRIITLLVAAIALAAVSATVGIVRPVNWSRASYTSSSQSDVSASAASVVDWLTVYSASPSTGLDPDGLGNYARQQNVTTLPLVASGQSAGLALNWGSYPDLNKTFDFTRVLTLRTPATAFPDPTVTQVTVTVTLLPDAGGTQPLRNPYLHLTTGTGFTNTVTMGLNQKAQLDISLRTKKNPWDAGDVFRPHVVLTLTYTGGPAAYYVYDYTTMLSII